MVSDTYESPLMCYGLRGIQGRIFEYFWSSFWLILFICYSVILHFSLQNPRLESSVSLSMRSDLRQL